MLYTLGQLKCNTVAIGRAVEWTGNIAALSCDARFAIANMTAEFGGIAGIFPADERTRTYVNQRPDHKSDALYFRADDGAEYAESFDIVLDTLEPQIALFPSPDNVQSVATVAKQHMTLDGCFIGACTTALEDLVMAALVLRQAMRQGQKPVLGKKRRVTPGSVAIIRILTELDLLQVYEAAGFTVGAPGCSYCLGIAADKAGAGEVWLSSQNRNYRNRMGKNSEANLASSVTVAASSFDMVVTDPRPLLNQLDQEEVRALLSRAQGFDHESIVEQPPIVISHPRPALRSPSTENPNHLNDEQNQKQLKSLVHDVVGRVQVFGDSVDTDAILPGEFLCENDVQALGKVAFLHTHPDFRHKVKAGQSIIVAGHGFGCGSSREQAVTALKGAGVQAIIAKSFGYIFSRNYQNFSLLGIQVSDPEFYAAAAHDNVELTVRTAGRVIAVGAKTFRYQMSLFEERLLAGGGVLPLYKALGNRLFRVAARNTSADDHKRSRCGESETSRCTTGEHQRTDLNW